MSEQNDQYIIDFEFHGNPRPGNRIFVRGDSKGVHIKDTTDTLSWDGNVFIELDQNDSVWTGSVEFEGPVDLEFKFIDSHCGGVGCGKRRFVPRGGDTTNLKLYVDRIREFRFTDR